MKVESLQISDRGGLKVRTGAGTFVASLNEGDSVKAEVLSSEKGAVVMKTDSGQTFKAKLDQDVILSRGDRVLLEVTGKEAGIVTLAIREESAAWDTAGRPELVRGFDDQTLLPYASKLAELNFQVAEGTARLMKELITQSPGMTLDEAAFIASNKLTGDDDLIAAALLMISDGEKTGVMIEKLLDLLNAGEPPRSDAPPLQGGEFAETRRAEGVAPYSSLPTIDPNEIIAHNDINMQSRISTSNEEIFSNGDFSGDVSVIEEQNTPVKTIGTGVPAETDMPVEAVISTEIAITAETAIQAETTIEAEIVLPAETSISTESAISAETVTPGEEAIPAEAAGITQTVDSNKPIVRLLSEFKEFQGTPAPALERFSDMLLKVAKDGAAASNSDAEKLAVLLEKMFTRIERDDKDAGARIKSAKEELFARLAMLEETISRAAMPAKAEMLEQTRRLMDHVRALNNVDQFAYMQLPVQFGDERKTAELYIFKKKGGKRIDPDNINILLAIDLENMGHWEGLINFRNRDVSVKMEVRGSEEKEYFGKNTVLLHEMLAEAGFKLVNTDITYSTKETTPLTALSAIGRFTRGRGIDLSV